jgi:hypothetical protein
VPKHATILDFGPEHIAVDRKHATTVLDPGLEHAIVDRKHVAAVLNPGPGPCHHQPQAHRRIIDLKHVAVIVDLNPVVDTLSVSLVCPLLICE